MSSSGDESSQSEHSGEITMYRCRMCPDQQFTAAERDLHRQHHKKEKIRRPRSELTETGTLFEPVTTDNTPVPVHESSASSGDKSPSPKPKKKSAKPTSGNKPGPKCSKSKQRKIRSEKKYDRHVEQPVTDGG